MTAVSADIRRGLRYAGLIIAVAGGAKIAAAYGFLGIQWPGRAMMAVMGAFVMATGNAIPKTLAPLSTSSCDPAALQRLQRQAGWMFAVAGAVIMIGWLALPESLARLSTLPLVPVTAWVVAQIVRLRRSR